MKNLTLLIIAASLVFSLCHSVFAQEENIQQFGEYSVHYSIFPSTFLSAEVASAYKIKRSEYEKLINIFISKQGETGGVPARVEGKTRNLMQQQQQFNFQEIIEDNTVYYIAPFKVSSDEILHFEINAKLADSTETLNVKFTKKVFKN